MLWFLTSTLSPLLRVWLSIDVVVLKLIFWVVASLTTFVSGNTLSNEECVYFNRFVDVSNDISPVANFIPLSDKYRFLTLLFASPMSVILVVPGFKWPLASSIFHTSVPSNVNCILLTESVSTISTEESPSIILSASTEDPAAVLLIVYCAPRFPCAS